MWYEHLIHSEYKILKYINDNPNISIVQVDGFLIKDLSMKHLSLRHVQRVLQEFKTMGFVERNMEGKYSITNKGRRVINLEKMFQDKAAEIV